MCQLSRVKKIHWREKMQRLLDSLEKKMEQKVGMTVSFKRV